MSSINAIIEDLATYYQIPHMALAVVKSDGNLWFSHGDYLNDEEEMPFEICSLSKAFTAMGVYHLVFAGQLSLDAPITEFIPSLRLYFSGVEVASQILVRHLLHHTSGLTSATIKLYNKKNSKSLSALIEALSGCSISENPGQSFSYASVNYDLLAYLVEQISKQPFSLYMKNEIFIPLGLTRTYCSSNYGRSLTGHKIGFYSMRPFVSIDHSASDASGYIVSCLHDMARWMSIQLGYEKDIPERFFDIISMTRKPDISVSATDIYYYAGGWHKHILRNQYIHAGNNPGFSSAIRLDIKKGIGICVLCDANTNAPRYVVDAVQRVLKGYQPTEYPDDRMKDIDVRFIRCTIFSGTAFVASILWMFASLMGN